MLMKQKGIIIKSVDYGESDKIITILNEYGAKIPLMARRAKKVKSGLQANTQLFVYGLFIYNKWRGMGTLNSVDVINHCLLYTSPSPRDVEESRMPSSA